MKKYLLLCLCTLAFAVQAKELSSAEKADMLNQFVTFQQSVNAQNATALKPMIRFPLGEETLWMIANNRGDIPKEANGALTAKLFDKYSGRFIYYLSDLARVKVDLAKNRIINQRIDSLTPQQKARKYYPASEDGQFYYLDGKKKVSVDGVCDAVREGKFDGDTLEVTLSSSPNKILPCMSEGESSTFYRFKLINKRLQLVSVQVAG